jgi:hypothetical protein
LLLQLLSRGSGPGVGKLLRQPRNEATARGAVSQTRRQLVASTEAMRRGWACAQSAPIAERATRELRDTTWRTGGDGCRRPNVRVWDYPLHAPVVASMAELAPSHDFPSDWPFLVDGSSCRFFEVLSDLRFGGWWIQQKRKSPGDGDGWNGSGGVHIKNGGSS